MPRMQVRRRGAREGDAMSDDNKPKHCPFCGGEAQPSFNRGILKARCRARCTAGVGWVLLAAWNVRPRIEGSRRAMKRVKQLEGLLAKSHEANVNLIEALHNGGQR